MDTLLDDFAIITEIPVAWGEMDAFQHVNNTTFFRYFETARIEYFKHIHLMDEMAKTHIGPVVSETYCRYKAPITFPDTLLVGSKVTDLQEDRFVMHYAVVSKKLKRITNIGSATIVMFDFKNNKKASLPASIRAQIASIEKS